MKVFDPGPIVFGDFATAIFAGTQRLPDVVVATYRLEPQDPGEFQSQIGQLGRRHLGAPYSPAPGLSLTIAPISGQDEFGLFVSLSHSHGKALSSAAQAFGRTEGSLVDQGDIRALFRGYMRRAGVA